MFIQNFPEQAALSHVLVSVQKAEQLSLRGSLALVTFRHSDSWPGVFPFKPLTQTEVGGRRGGIGTSFQQKAGQSPCCGYNEASPRASQCKGSDFPEAFEVCGDVVPA